MERSARLVTTKVEQTQLGADVSGAPQNAAHVLLQQLALSAEILHISQTCNNVKLHAQMDTIMKAMQKLAEHVLHARGTAANVCLQHGAQNARTVLTFQTRSASENVMMDITSKAMPQLAELASYVPRTVDHAKVLSSAASAQTIHISRRTSSVQANVEQA